MLQQLEIRHKLDATMWKDFIKVLPLAFHESSILPCEIFHFFGTKLMEIFKDHKQYKNVKIK